MQAQLGSSIALHILNFGARLWWVINATPRLLYPREGTPSCLSESSGCSGGVWRKKYITRTEFRTPNRSAPTQSLYQPHFQGSRSSTSLLTVQMHRVSVDCLSLSETPVAYERDYDKRFANPLPLIFQFIIQSPQTEFSLEGW
jgi:hypothetical protein